MPRHLEKEEVREGGRGEREGGRERGRGEREGREGGEREGMKIYGSNSQY